MKKRIISSLFAMGIFLMLAMSGGEVCSQEISGWDTLKTKLTGSFEQYRIEHNGLFFTHTYLNLNVRDESGMFKSKDSSYTLFIKYLDTIYGRPEKPPHIRSVQFANCQVDSYFMVDSVNVLLGEVSSLKIIGIDFIGDTLKLPKGSLQDGHKVLSIKKNDSYILKSGPGISGKFEVDNDGSITLGPGTLIHGCGKSKFDSNVKFITTPVDTNLIWEFSVTCKLSFRVLGTKSSTTKIGGGLCVIIETLDPPPGMHFKPSFDLLKFDARNSHNGVVSSLPPVHADSLKFLIGRFTGKKCLEFPLYYSPPASGSSNTGAKATKRYFYF